MDYRRVDAAVNAGALAMGKIRIAARAGAVTSRSGGHMTASKIDCPNCGTAMDLQHRGETEIDACHECGGLWFDAGELERIAGASSSSEAAGTQYRKCPRCHMKMRRVVLAGVHLERCDACQGFFADAGELEQIARRAKQARPREVPREVVASRGLACQKCNGSFSRDKLYAVPGGYLCDKCSSFVEPEREPDPEAADEAASGLLNFFWHLVVALTPCQHGYHPHHRHLDLWFK